MPAIQQTRMKAWQFLAWEHETPGIRLELVDGELEVSPSPSFSHSYTERMLTIRLGHYVVEHGLGALFGDVDIEFSE